jgi:hypothetical protein
MADPPLESRSVRIEVQTGAVRASNGERVVLVSASALDELAREVGSHVTLGLGRAVGRAIGAAAAATLGDPEAVRVAPLEQVTQHLAEELALHGFGALSVERWGRALVLAVLMPAIDDDALLAAVLEGALGAATGRETPCMALGRDLDVFRVLVASRKTIALAQGWFAEGVTWGDVLARLNTRAGIA